MKKYEMKVNTKDKVFDITLNGFFLEEDANQFVKDYSRNVASMQVKQYNLLIDCTKLSTIKADLIPSLQGCFKLYMSSGFKGIIFINPSTATGTMQIKRVATSVGMKAQFAGSRVEANKLIKNT